MSDRAREEVLEFLSDSDSPLPGRRDYRDLYEWACDMPWEGK